MYTTIYPPNVSPKHVYPANLTDLRSKSFYPTGVQIPYVYLIGWTQHKVFYVGVQFRKKANPNNLWTTYFTSSQFVKKFREEHGDPDRIQIRRAFQEGEVEKARLWESKFIQKVGAVHSDSWLNMCNRGKEFCCKGHSPESRQKISESKKGKVLSLSPETRQKMSEVRKGRIFSQESRQKLSMANKGKTHSLETRQKMSEVRKGKILSSEHRQKLSKAINGKTRSPETRQKMSEVRKGKTRSPETCQKLSEGKRGKVYWNDGIKNYLISPNEPHPEEWVVGKKPRKPTTV